MPSDSLPGGFYRADVHAGGVFALLALHGHVELTLRRHGVIVVHVTLREIHGALLHLEHANVRLVSLTVVIVLFVTGLHAAATSDANTQIEGIRKLNVFLRLDVANGDLCPVFASRVRFKPGDQLLFRGLV